MEPLSCKNCCHNPLQLGGIGTSFGYCVRHRMALSASHLTTCGQLLRKDLLRARAATERETHAGTFSSRDIRLVTDPLRSAAAEGLVERLNEIGESELVLEEVVNYGTLGNKIGTIATLRHAPGARAEVARISLGRGYLRNCADRGGPWTAGLHILWWTLRRLPDEPTIDASEVLGPITLSLAEYVRLAQWHIVAFRLAMICDVADHAAQEGDEVAALGAKAREAIVETEPGDPASLVGWIRTHIDEFASAFSRQRYQELRENLHREQSNED